MGPPAYGQLSKVSEIVLANNESARGVSFEAPYAYVALRNNGIQWVVDLTNPLTPLGVTSFNPAFGNEQAENFIYNGMLIAGHRQGGLNLWKGGASPAQLDTAVTTDHRDGLDVLDVTGQAVLFYSEHNAASAPAGIRVYDISGGTLLYLGDNLAANNQRDGRFLIATLDSWVYQLDGGFNSTRPLNLNVYDVSIPSAPLYAGMFGLGNTVGNYAGLTDLELDPTERILYTACGYDGLRMVDISIRPAPVVVNTLAAPNFYVKELSHLDGTVLMVMSARLPSGQWRFRVLNCTNPVAPLLLGSWLGDPNYIIHDLKAVQMAVGPAVLVAGKNASGQATLQVWM